MFMLLWRVIKPQNHNSLNQMLTANVGMASLKGDPVGNTFLTEKSQRDLGIITYTKMKRPHTSIQLPSKICILVCLYDGVSHEQMYAVQQEAAMAQVFLWGWALPTSLSCGCFSPILSLQPCQGHDISNATLNPRETALEQLPSHPSAAEWPAQPPSLLYWQSRMARQENSSSPAQGEIWQAETPEYLRDIIN